MKNVVLLVRKGPTAGNRIEIELGRVQIGRETGPGHVLLTGDFLVSRRHGELREEDERVFYCNLSSNGTLVDGENVKGEREIAPGAELRMGEYLLEVQFRQGDRKAPQNGEEGGSLWRGGLLSRPAVRAGLVAYLLSLVALAVVLGLRDETTILDEFKRARDEYRAEYRPEGVRPEERKARVDRAERLVDDLFALERAESWDMARAACRALMAIDRDPTSPIYLFGARHLGALAAKRTGR